MNEGTLRATLNLPSYALTHNLPIEVRDASLALVARITHDTPQRLKPGLYQVSAVLHDGRTHARVVRVVAGEEVPVELIIDPADLMPTERPRSPLDRFVDVTSSFAGTSDDTNKSLCIEKLIETGLFGRPRLPPAKHLNLIGDRLLDLVGARLVEAATDQWVFVPDDTPTEAVPYALFDVHGEKRSISLPVNPNGHTDEERACVLRFETYDEGVEPRAWIHHARTVSSTMQHMVAGGQLFHAQSVAAMAADDLLRGKYDDPVGAGLGSLVLYQAGTLRDRISWLENLAGRFDWLPDGKILLGVLLLDSPPERDRGAKLLFRAADQRPMFTLSYSILLDTFRRWPIRRHTASASSAAKTLSRTAASVDWNAFVFTQREL